MYMYVKIYHGMDLHARFSANLRILFFEHSIVTRKCAEFTVTLDGNTIQYNTIKYNTIIRLLSLWKTMK